VPSEAAATPLPAEGQATATIPVSSTAALPAGTALASPTAAPDVVIVPRTPSPLNNQERWRAQEIDRQVLQTAQTYIAKNPVALLWYDPLAGQSLEIGTLIGEFTVQARFTLRSTNSPALEVPYRINFDYGLTSISDAVRERMQAAGYTESVEAYVVEAEGIVPK
jgi:hypothetical protein